MKTNRISISKYNPLFRDVNGAYINNEWTSISDIGKIYDNKIFSWEDYIETESLYVKAIFKILKYFQSNGIIISHLFQFEDKNYFNKYGNDNLKVTLQMIQTGDYISEINTISNLIELRLREHIAELELKIEGSSQANITFGFDYYMYLETDHAIDPLQEQIKELGLYCVG